MWGSFFFFFFGGGVFSWRGLCFWCVSFLHKRLAFQALSISRPPIASAQRPSWDPGERGAKHTALLALGANAPPCAHWSSKVGGIGLCGWQSCLKQYGVVICKSHFGTCLLFVFSLIILFPCVDLIIEMFLVVFPCFCIVFGVANTFFWIMCAVSLASLAFF